MTTLARLFALALLLGACGAAAPAPPPSGTAATATPGASAARPALRTVTYCTNGGRPLAMDLALPPRSSALPVPAVLYVHGGGWQGGSRLGGAYLAEVRAALVARGFVVASIDYRLAPESTWPAQIVDAKCAVRYLRAHAAVYGIDPSRIGAWGGSAGGHLVAMLGAADASAGFDVGEWSGESSRVQAVVDLFGPADLGSGGWSGDTGQIIRDVFGVAPGAASEVLAKASPVTYVTPDDPPFLILHGDADRTVPVAQSRTLAAVLEAARVPTTLVIVTGGPHGLGDARQRPSPDSLTDTIVAFLTRTLG